MNSITIRKVQPKDNNFLAQIIKTTFVELGAPLVDTVYSDPTTDALFELFNEPKSILWVALVDNEVVGCCGIYPTPNLPNLYTELVKFYLTANARGKGIGKQLLQYCINSAKDLGYKNIYLECTPQFTAALQLYKQFNFNIITHHLGKSGHSGCSIFMEKEI